MTGTRAVILAAGKGTRMASELPKVLHRVGGRPMIAACVDHARAAGAGEIVVVVGYGADQVREALDGEDLRFVVQEVPLGTGHAVAQAGPHLEGFGGHVVVLYGDMPLLRPATIGSLVEHRERTGAAAVALTVVLDNPPDFGRIVRGGDGGVARIVEVKDATAEELAIREVNVGAYCFQAHALLEALGRLRNDNRQGEYYLTDVVEILAGAGRRVEAVTTTDLVETLGINDRDHLAFAETLDDIRHAEGLFELVDAVLTLGRRSAGGER